MNNRFQLHYFLVHKTNNSLPVTDKFELESNLNDLSHKVRFNTCYYERNSIGNPIFQPLAEQE